MKKYLMYFMLGIVASLAIGMTGCGGKEEVSFASLEEAKQTARENSMFNAQRYRQENPRYQAWSILSRGDSSQTNDCPQGDGWATLEFNAPDMSRMVKVKCSTVSGATGCLEDAEFKTKPYAPDDGQCQSTNKVPYPLPKIAK